MSTKKTGFHLSPLGTGVNLLFVSLVTVLLLWLCLFPDTDFIRWIRHRTTPGASLVLGIIPLPAWYVIALFTGIYIPLLILILYQFRRWLNELLLPYLLVCIMQLVTEAVLATIFFPGFAWIAGILYTTYRIWQRQTAISLHNQRIVGEEGANSFLQNFLMLAAGFWMLHLLYLLSAIIT